MIFFRDQDITQDQHVAFGRASARSRRRIPTLPAVFDDFPEILLLDNQRYAPMGAATSRAAGTPTSRSCRIRRWARSCAASSYRRTAATRQWTNLAVAYDRLSEPIKQLLDGLHAVHHNDAAHLARRDVVRAAQAVPVEPLQSVHPVVRVHPETGERVLFVNPNFTSHIFELSRQESGHLLAMLYEHHANAAFTCRFRWQPGSIAFWDNRATAHLVPTDVPGGHHRSMQRITIAGDVPVGPDGSTSYTLTGDTFG